MLEPLENSEIVEAATDTMENEQPKNEEFEETAEDEQAALAEDEKQTPEQDHYYAEQRRKEQIEQLRQENAKYTQEINTLLNAINVLDYSGTPQEIADQIIADKEGIPITEVQRKRQQNEQEIINNPLVKQLVEQNNALMERQRQDVFKSHLSLIKQYDPNVSINRIEDLGREFIAILAAQEQQKELTNDDVIRAYEMVKAGRNKTAKPKPNFGSVNTSQPKEYFSRDEVKAMTPDEVRKNFDKIEKSMGKW